MPKILFTWGDDFKILASVLFILITLSLPFAYWQQAKAVTGAVTITTTVATSLTFQTTTGASDEFGTITAGTPKFATTTLAVATNDTLGWTTSLSGDQKNSQPQNNLQLGTPPATSTQITDQTEWVPASATSSAGNAARISALVNSGNVLAYRVMTASSTNGAAFFAASWWGTADSYVDNANTLWAGIPSSTVQRNIGSAGAGSYSASAHLNTVNYYLNVAATQPTGNYSAPLTFTAVGN